MTSADAATVAPPLPERRVRSELPFYLTLATIGGFYVVLLVGLVVADVAYMVTAESGEQASLSASLESLVLDSQEVVLAQKFCPC